MLDRFECRDSSLVGVGLNRKALDNLADEDVLGPHRRVVENIVEIIIRDKFGNEKHRSETRNLRVNGGADFWDQQLFKISTTLSGTNTISSIAAASGTGGPNSTATTVYTGTFTNAGSNAYVGYLITLTGGSTAANNGTYLCVASTTTTLTLANPNGAAQSSGTEPTVWTTVWTGQGGFIANYIALSTDSTTPAGSDTSLASEQTTNGLARAQATDTHSAGAASSSLAHTWTYTGSSSVTIAKVGLFTQSSNGVMILETLLSSTATVNNNGDTITVTWTINF